MTRHRLAALIAAALVVVPASAAASASAAATVAAATVASVEAETFSLAARAGAVVAESHASGGHDLLIWANGTANRSMTLTAPAGAVTLRARGDQCHGAPTADVTVDGAHVATVTVAATTWTSYSLAGTWTAGVHQVSISFGNDYTDSGCDRNLRVDTIAFAPSAAPRTARTFGLSENDGTHRGLSGALATASALGHHLDEFNFYMAWAYREAFPTADVQAITAAGANPSITWEPWQPGSGAWQAEYNLDAIANGSYDSYIDSWARAAAAFGKPVTLRFAHEMNGSWYPWSASVNGNSPAKYVAAFRHVHDRFVAAGASNVVWVWSVNIVDGMPTALSQLYPGSGYVDAIGVDGYNGGTDNPGMGGWKSPATVFASTLSQLAQLAPGKPVYIAETGCAVGGGDKSAWIRDLFAYIATTAAVKGVDWFQFGGYPDWRLTSSTSTTSAARAALASL